MVTTNRKVIARLHSYHNALYRLKHLGFVKVFSDNLADAVGVTSSQVRKDLCLFGPSGNKRGGYLVDDLIPKLNAILGKDNPQDIIVVGAGNIGTALMNYPGFQREGIKIVAAFDRDPAKVRREAPVPVLPLDELKDFVSRNHIKVGIIAVPDTAAQQVLDALIAAGIKGILNFAPIRLNAPEGFVINHVNVGVELETVIYFVNSLDRPAANKEEIRTAS